MKQNLLNFAVGAAAIGFLALTLNVGIGNAQTTDSKKDAVQGAGPIPQGPGQGGNRGGQGGGIGGPGGPGGQGGFGQGPGGPGGQGRPMMGGGGNVQPVMVEDNQNLYVLLGNRMFKVAKGEFKVVGMVELPMRPPMDGGDGQGAPGAPPLRGGGEPAAK